MKSEGKLTRNVAFSAPPERYGEIQPARAAVVLIAAVTMSPGIAHAYLDPGTGSILVQGVIAAVVAAIGYVGMYWQRTKQLLASIFRREEKDSQAQSESEKRDQP